MVMSPFQPEHAFTVSFILFCSFSTCIKHTPIKAKERSWLTMDVLWKHYLSTALLTSDTSIGCLADVLSHQRWPLALGTHSVYLRTMKRAPAGSSIGSSSHSDWMSWSSKGAVFSKGSLASARKSLSKCFSSYFVQVLSLLTTLRDVPGAGSAPPEGDSTRLRLTL